MTETVAAGWYPAPHAGGELRYWDGAAWHAAPPFVPPGTAPGMTRPHPYGPAAPTARQGLAVAALVVGAGALFLGLVPFVGAAIALAGTVLGIVALVKRQHRVLSVLGLVLSGVALVWGGLVTAAVVVSIVDAAGSSVDAEAPSAPAPEASDPSDGTGIGPLAPESGAGSFAEPLPQPYVSEGSSGVDYRAEVRMWDDDATAEVAAWNEYNPAPGAGEKYVLVEMTVTGGNPEGTEASYAAYDLSLATSAQDVYGPAFILAEQGGVPLLTDFGTLDEGERVTGVVAYLVPVGAEDFELADYRSFYDF